MLKHTKNTNNSGIRFYKQITMNNIAPKLQNCWKYKIAFKIISKMLKQPNFFYSQPFALPKFYLSTTSGLSFMVSSVASTQSSTFYAYLTTKIGNRSLRLSQWKLGARFLILNAVKAYPILICPNTFCINSKFHTILKSEKHVGQYVGQE